MVLRPIAMPVVEPMLMPFGRLTAGGGGVSFDATTLYAAGEKGDFLFFDRLGSMWQDAGMSVPAAVGSPVVKMTGINGTVFTFTGWSLAQDQYGFYCLRRTGGNTSKGISASVDFSGTSQVTMFAAVRAAISTSHGIVHLGDIGAAGTCELQFSGGAPLTYYQGSGSFGARFAASVGASPVVLTSIVDLTGTTYATENPTLRVNGAQGALSNAGSADTGTGPFGTWPITVGNSYEGTGGFNGNLYAVGIRGAASTALEYAAVESYLSARSPAALTFSHAAAAADFWDTYTPVASGSGYFRASAFAHVDYTTTATVMEVDFFDALSSTYPTWAEIGVYVNGVFYQTIASNVTSGASFAALNLPSGSKTVSFVNGLQIGGGASGAFFIGVKANAAVTVVQPASTNRVVVYGDSISVGGNSTDPVEQAWAIRVRNAYSPNSIAVEGYGSRSLYDDCVDSTARAAFVSKLSAYFAAATGTQRLWLCIGTNDFGLNKWTAADFGTAYAALLDDLHTALPSLAIYCQTPITRAGEGSPNGLGSFIADYRTQIATAVSTRTSYSTLVDGTAILNYPADYEDSVHPSTAGHAKYALAVRATLSI